MPQNKRLNPISLPMELKFGQEPQTEFYNNLSHIKVELVDAPTRSQALNVAWQYVKATWADHHDDCNPNTTSLKELSSNLEDVLNGMSWFYIQIKRIVFSRSYTYYSPQGGFFCSSVHWGQRSKR